MVLARYIVYLSVATLVGFSAESQKRRNDKEGKEPIFLSRHLLLQKVYQKKSEREIVKTWKSFFTAARLDNFSLSLSLKVTTLVFPSKHSL